MRPESTVGNQLAGRRGMRDRFARRFPRDRRLGVEIPFTPFLAEDDYEDLRLSGAGGSRRVAG
jgi:hypothetical protein